MSKPKLILTDCDGVLFDWVSGFNHWAKQSKNLDVRVDFEQFYDIADWYGLTHADAMVLVKEYNASAAIGFLPPYSDAVTYVKKLHHVHGYKFVAITAMGDEPYASRLRWNNLRDIFGEGVFLDLHITKVNGDKTDFLNAYESTIWIEDKPANAELGLLLGHRTFLMEHEHNKALNTSPGITRVDNWKELYNRILEEEKETCQQ